ncbi:LysR family transcriptional regulator [Halotalea alkalilenta]|uniref:LysR family transcriptional regulator n=1 Tax=Halotalea alkalilenta TaxID=376489 RepID=UPI001B806BAC|nr:LysR family transcriptional regulator [Halotalea alkalilenta]
MMYTLKQIEAFYWSCLLGSFSASSKKLHATQSAVAKRVAELESFVGRPLLERSTPFTLTPAGQQLFSFAQEMLELNSRIIDRMADPSGLEGIVQLGATELIGLTWLATLIHEVRSRYPKLQLLPELDGGITLYERLRRNEIDVAILPGPFWSYEFDSIYLGAVQKAWMVSPSLGIDAGATLSPNDLTHYPIISQPASSAAAHMYDAWYAKAGLAFERVITCNNLGMIAKLTMMGLGISHLQQTYFQPLVEAGLLQQLDVQPPLPEVCYYAVFRKRSINPVTTKLIELMQEVCDFDVAGSFLPQVVTR